LARKGKQEMDQIVAMLLSMASEAPAAALLGMIGRRRLSILAAAAAVLGTFMTHPIVWYGALRLYEVMDYWPAFAIVEAYAILCETIVYQVFTGLSWPRAFALSFAANWASIVLGWTLVG
jgi:hypothetical protein